MKEIFSSGGGTQSSAITALIIQGKLPRPDVVVIADTGYERATTWQYLDQVIRPALAKIGLKVHRVSPREWATQPAHGKRWLTHNGNTVLLPGFSSRTEGEIGKLPGFCSSAWKSEPITRYMTQVMGIESKHQRHWIGFSLDEARRATRMMVSRDYLAGKIRLPLIHDVPLKRAEAIRVVESMGWPTPPRSACFMCPNMAEDEWRGITADELKLAGDLERQIQESDPNFWLHRSLRPIESIQFNELAPPDDTADRACSSGNCFV